MSFSYLYRQNDAPESVYILRSGNIHFYVTNTERYTISGNNLIIGASEIILSHYLNIATDRLENAVYNESSVIKHLDREKFIQQFNRYPYLLNVSRVLAKKLMLTNHIIKTNQSELLSDFVSLKSICITYFSMLEIIKEEYSKRRLPFLKNFIAEYANTLTYVKGESFSRAETPVRITPSEALDERMVSLPPGDTLFTEGDPGNEMYILNSGSINVIVNENRVATLSEPGTPIGEIALLLGEKRTATLVTSSEVVLTKITSNDLEFIAGNDIDTFYNIVYSLTKKYYNNIHKIRDIHYQLINSELDREEGSRSTVQERQKASDELEKLRKAVDELLYKNDVPYLKEKLHNYISST